MNAPARRPLAATRELSIRGALEWAFAVEKAQLELPGTDDADAMQGAGLSRSRLATMVEAGTTVDTSHGQSFPHVAADRIAEAVARLPRALGGTGMAREVAAPARARTAPDCADGAVPRLEPAEWRENQHGRRARTEVVEVVRVRTRRRGRTYEREVEVRACPLHLSPTPHQIAQARRRYAAWRAALEWLGAELRGPLAAEGVALTDELPAERPWVPLAAGWEAMIEAAG